MTLRFAVVSPARFWPVMARSMSKPCVTMGVGFTSATMGPPTGFTVKLTATVPAGVVFADVDAMNGQRAGALCPVVAREVFLADTVPGPCEEHGHLGEHIQNWWNRFRNWFGR